MQKAKFIFRIACLGMVMMSFQTKAFNPSDTAKAGKTETEKKYFWSAKEQIENMLSGKEPLNYEKAVFITENVYYENKKNYESFKKELDGYTDLLQSLYLSQRLKTEKDFTRDIIETSQDKYRKYELLLKNWVIYKFITDTTHIINNGTIYSHYPFNYSYNDPLATNNWQNSQVMHLLFSGDNLGNCYALVSLFKIFAERLGTDAKIATAPNHIYIVHKDDRDIEYNVELGSRAFPGNGSMATLTFLTDKALKNGVGMRYLDIKQSIALNLVYLAKSYQQKFKITDDDFILDCANAALRYDEKNLNAMLLKAEVEENRLFDKFSKNNITTPKEVAKYPDIQKEFAAYEKEITGLYDMGYLEMPVEMKNLLISAYLKDNYPVSHEDHTPTARPSSGVKHDDDYITLSGGLFDEMHFPKPIEKYSRVVLDTKTKKIIAFQSKNTTYNNYNFDPVLFAWSIDPLYHKYPSWSPYSAFANNPIVYVDNDGSDVIKSEAFTKSENREAAYQTFITTTQAQNLLNKFASNTGDYKSSTPGALANHSLLFDTKTGKLALGLTTLKIEINGKFEDYNPKKHAGLVDDKTKFQVQVNLYNEKNAGAGAAILNHEAFVFAEEYANALEAYQSGKMSADAFKEKLSSLNNESGIEKAYMKVLDPKSTYTAAQKELVQKLQTAGKTKDATAAKEVHETDIKQVKEDYNVK